MKRNLLATLVGLIVAPLILYLGLYLQLRFTSFGGLIYEPSKVHNFDYTMHILRNTLLVNRWLISPVAACVAASLARLIAQRSDWVRCIVIILPIAAMNGDFGLSGLAESIVYVVIAYAAMKVIDFVRRMPSERSITV
jgi:hypothetical protein